MGKKNRKNTLLSPYDEASDYADAYGKETRLEGDLFDYMQPNEDSTETAPSNKTKVPQKLRNTKKLSIHEMANRIQKNHCLINKDGLMYLCDAPPHKPAKFAEITELLRGCLKHEEIIKLSMSDFKGLYEYLFTLPSLQEKKVQVKKGCVLCENGYFDIVNGKKITRNSSELILFKVKASFLPNEYLSTPHFDSLLNDWSGGNEEIKALILSVIGYCLIPDQDGKCFFVLGPAPDSGKSLLAKLLEHLIGVDLISNISLNSFGNTFAAAPLVGKILNLSMDLSPDCLNGTSVSNLKMLTGGDRITINEKYVPMFSYQNYAKFLFATNDAITIKKPDKAFYDRMVLIPLLNSIPKNKQDKKLVDKLWEERDGIVTKALNAARKLILKNYEFPNCRAAEMLKNSWAMGETTSIGYFINECCTLGNEEKRIFVDVLYKKYCHYCNKKSLKIETKNMVSRFLNDQYGLERDRWSENNAPAQRGFIGIEINEK